MTEKSDKIARSIIPGLNAHRLVAEQAVAMAQELFEVYAAENATYKALRANGKSEKSIRKVFVRRVAPKLLEEARQALSQLLIQEHVSQMAKDEVYEALIADNELRANRMVAKNKATVPPILLN